MSADNWTQCPQCVKNKNNALKEIDESYGNVSVEHYKKMLDAFYELTRLPTDTLREDFEQGIKENEYFVDYSAHCLRCGFSFKYQFNKEVTLL